MQGSRLASPEVSRGIDEGLLYRPQIHATAKTLHGHEFRGGFVVVRLRYAAIAVVAGREDHVEEVGIWIRIVARIRGPVPQVHEAQTLDVANLNGGLFDQLATKGVQLPLTGFDPASGQQVIAGLLVAHQQDVAARTTTVRTAVTRSAGVAW